MRNDFPHKEVQLVSIFRGPDDSRVFECCVFHLSNNLNKYRVQLLVSHLLRLTELGRGRGWRNTSGDG